jgi:hypothetical protein
VNAARNVLARCRDEEIHLWMKTIQVKSILLRRSPCQPVGTAQPGLQLRMSTESEIPDLRSNA